MHGAATERLGPATEAQAADRQASAGTDAPRRRSSRKPELKRFAWSPDTNITSLGDPGQAVRCGKRLKAEGLMGVAAAAILITPPALGDASGERYGHHMMWDGAGWLMLLGPLMMLLFLAGFAALVVLGVRWLLSSGHASGGPSPPASGRLALDILKERLARGEIEVAEYEERRKALGDG